MELEFIKEYPGECKRFKSGDTKIYKPWEHTWQGMSESERVLKGIFVECHGQNRFDVFTKETVNVKGEDTEKTYTIAQIKKAYFAEFHEAGEMFFSYLGTPEENLESTEEDFKDFLLELDT